MLEFSKDTNPSVLEKRREFQEVAFEHMDSLYNTALRMTKNEVDAQDLVQDVYVRAYRFFDKFKRGTNFKAWIFKILTNTFINQYRKKTSQPYHIEFDKVQHNYEGDKVGDSFEQLVDSLDDNYDMLFDDEIKRALQALSDDFRMVVILADIESFSYKEIARIIGCPIGTVMSRLSRGRRQLQNGLREYAIRGGFIPKERKHD
ncbi:sigma-70 family RNA polymerase sigma factor [bacterium]|nr:sigma-70 family RNA polymerase sigma factor [bacterium]